MEQINKAIEILQAFNEGKPIECQKPYETAWEKYLDGKDFLIHNLLTYHWRIAKEPTYRPYTTAKEFSLDYFKHRGLLKDKFCDNFYFTILRFNDNGFSCVVNGDMESYDMLMKQYVWADTLTPCGIAEE